VNLAKLEKLSFREKAGLFASLAFLFVAAVDNFVARPILRTLHDLDERILRERTQVEVNRGSLRWEKETAQLFDRIRDQLGSAASPAEAIAAMKGQIDTLARQDGIAIQKLDHREPRPHPGWEEYTVDIGSFEADVRNVLRFLQDIWQAPGMLRVVRLSLAPGAGQDMAKGSMSITEIVPPKDSEPATAGR